MSDKRPWQYRDPVARFWSRVDKNGPVPAHRPDLGPCWLWTGALVNGGYGTMSVKGALVYVHRFSYELHLGTIAAEMLVCHHCDNRRCVNPLHFFAGDHQSNASDMVAKGRSRGHRKLTPETVLAIREATGSQRAIARQFGISQRNVCSIQRREIWLHV